MILLCLVASIYIQIFSDANDPLYIEMPNPRGVKGFFTSMGTWILLLANLVPISLLVTMELVKFAQGFFIMWDAEIYSIDKDMPAKVQSNNLIDQLGQIDYIFSDKTGTLTQNVMEFRQMSAGLKSYGSLSSPKESIEKQIKYKSSMLTPDLYTEESNTQVPNVNF